jgi:glyoxylase-like metal-dependent hydrolase (beta-lactamase superfamily II)
MPKKAKLIREMLMIATVAALAFQTAGAQSDNAKATAGAKAKTAAVADAKAAATSDTPDVAKAIKAAADALGMPRTGGPGGQRLPEVDVVNRMEIWGSGTSYAFGQAYKPDGPWPAFKTEYHVALGYNPPAMRVEMTRTNPDGPIQGGGGLPLAAPQHTIQTVRDNYAWNESELGAGLLPGKGTATPAMAAVKERLLQLWILPYGVVKAAIAAGDKTKVSTENGAQVISFPLAGELAGVMVKATLDSKNFVTKVETRTDNPVLGDMVSETDYSDYADHGEILTDLKSPGHIVQKQGGYAVLDIQVKMADLNNPYLVFPVPDSVKKTATQGPAPVKVDTAKVADGVYYLTGGTHHSVAVEFNDYVALVECPLNDDRSLAVIDAVKKAIPNKPIKYVIATHHHFDHTGGLRACVAEGATIITQTENVPYFEKVLAMPHTIKPDKEAQVKKKPVLEAVADKRILTDGKQTLELYHLAATDHADTMLIGYLPKAKILIEADVWNPAPANAPPAPVAKENVNLYDQIKKLNLDVAQITPLHGRLVTMNDLAKLIGKSSGSGN